MPLLSMWFLAATVCQGPSAGWLDAVPPEADVVVRVRGVEAVRNDLVAMIKAMSPKLGEQATPALEQAVAHFKEQFGEAAASSEYLALVRAVPPEDPTQPPFAIIVKASNYDGIIKSVSANKEAKPKHEDAGYDSFDGPTGGTWYAAKGAGTVAFGPDKTLIAGFTKPGAKSLGKTLSPEIQKQFAGGDLGIYVNISALATRYAEQIDQGKQGLMATLDQAGAQAGNAGMMEMIKKMYGGMFDSIKQADGLSLSLDFSAEGLGVAGLLTVKPDSSAAKVIPRIQPGDAAGVAKLPVESAYFTYMNVDAKTMQNLQLMGLRMMAPGGKAEAEIEAAVAKEKGRVEATGAITMANGMKMFNVSTISDPKSFAAAIEASMKAMSAADSPLSFFKEMKFTPKAETYRGFSFNRCDMTLDVEKFSKLQPGNPRAAETVKAMYGGDKITSWYGINDTHMIQVMAPSWDDAKAQIDTYFQSGDRLGATAGYKAVRAKLPEKVSFLMLMSAQGLVKQFTTQFAAMGLAPNAKVPADLPKDPALMGVSLTPAAPNGFEFHLVVPSTVGPIFEKGLVPVFSGMKPPGNP